MCRFFLQHSCPIREPRSSVNNKSSANEQANAQACPFHVYSVCSSLICTHFHPQLLYVVNLALPTHGFTEHYCLLRSALAWICKVVIYSGILFLLLFVIRVKCKLLAVSVIPIISQTLPRKWCITRIPKEKSGFWQGTIYNNNTMCIFNHFI